MRLSLALVVVLSLCIVVGVRAMGTEKVVAKQLELNLGGGVKLKLVLIPAGTFEMGSVDGAGDERPVHEVTIAKAFYVGVTEVTQAQYQAVMGSNPSYSKGPQLPVEQVSWHDAVEFCERLSQKIGKRVRLPSEAQWEYACRAGGLEALSYFDEAAQLGPYSWDASNSGGESQLVETKAPNAWGLYDMHGNVWEWCLDHWNKSYTLAPCDGSAWTTGDASKRVIRGGSWYSDASACRSSHRHSIVARGRNLNRGFRVVVSLSQTP